MKIYEICIKPTSGFVTPLQGDCLFGQICWQIAQDSRLAGDISEILVDYDTKPFCIISDPVIKLYHENSEEYLFPKPFYPITSEELSIKAPFKAQIEEQKNRKSIKNAKWAVVSKKQKLNLNRKDSLLTVSGVKTRYNLDANLVISYRQSHNSIERFTGTTGDGQFAPFSTNVQVWNAAVEFSIFVGIIDDAKKAGIVEAIRRIGRFGYGADATTGKGCFDIVGEIKEIDLSHFGDKDGNALYTLSAAVPDDDYNEIYFEPFVRFGRHGGILANSEYPFKQPVLKASAGAVFIPASDSYKKQVYIGKAIKGVSKYPETVEQAYSLYIPLKIPPKTGVVS